MTQVLVNKDLWFRILLEYKIELGLSKERPVFVDMNWILVNKDLWEYYQGLK